ncbi:MAG: phosphoglycerate dehydrogenase [Thermodesulfobacteriota bacterium]
MIDKEGVFPHTIPRFDGFATHLITVKILVTDGIAPEGKSLLESASGIEPDIRSSIDADELKKVIKNYDGVIIRSATKITADIIDAADGSLKVIGRAGIGVDNVDIEAATRSGIVVMNTPEANAVTTAEHAIALMFSAARKVPQAHLSTSGGKWERGKFKGVELFGKTLGLIGLGTIGKLVAERAAGLKMTPVAFDPFLAPEAAEKMGVKLADLDETLSTADVITIHAPLTPQTKNMIDTEAIAKMKDGAILINCARGGIVDEDALCAAVESGKLAGAALDVFTSEPPESGSAILKSGVVLTPHLGASTAEAQEKVGAAIARQIIDFSGGVVKNAVNMPSLDAAEAESISPYMNLAEKMGAFLAQTCTGASKVKVEYRGDIAQSNTKVLSLSVLQGFLSKVMNKTVTQVNAPVIAKDRGIEVVEAKNTASGDYTNLITASVSAPEGKRSVSGVIFGRQEPRFVKVDGVPLDVAPEGILLISENHDKPGLIAGMCGIISAAGINIARMHLGREAVGGRAIVFTNVDSPVSEAEIEKIAALEGIISITQVTL